eukprot:5488169-Heterocapsa_arctica.AAC.1
MRVPPSGSLGKVGMAKSRALLGDSPASSRAAPGRRRERLNWPVLAPKLGNARIARLKGAACRRRQFIDGGSAPDGKCTATRRGKKHTQTWEPDTTIGP